MDFDKDIIGGYTINLEEVVKNKKLLSVTRLLASEMMMRPYLSVGDFLKNLSDGDLESLNDCVNNEQWDDIILMAEMLATGEGLESSKSFEEFKVRMAGLCGYFTVESLYRKGLVKVYHENISFGEDLGDKVVVEKL